MEVFRDFRAFQRISQVRKTGCFMFEVGGDIGGVRKDWKRLAEVGGG